MSGLCISGTVYDQIETKLSLNYEYQGEQTVKNIAKPIRVWRVQDDLSVETPQRGISTSPTPGKVSVGYRKRALLAVAGLLLIVVAIVAVRHFSFSLLGTQHSILGTEEAQPPSLPLPDKPSIAVLPFVNMSKDPERDYFSDGMTEDLTSHLSKISGLFVIARNSAFTYKGKAVKVQEVGRELGVRYVLEGSVRKADDQVRITAQKHNIADDHLGSVGAAYARGRAL